MNSIKSKILILIITSIVLVTSIVSVVLVKNTHDAFYKETIDKLEQMTFRYSSEFNGELHHVVTIAEQVEIVVEALFDWKKLENKNYLDDFEVMIAPVIKKIAESGLRTKSAYVFFLPTLDGKAHDVWYSDLNYNGIIDRQEEFPKEYYDEFIPGREWFFVPKETKEPYWTDPYQGNADYDAHITYISHTRPIIVADKLIGIVGSDYHFNLMNEDILNIKVFEKGYAFLLDENGDTLIHPTLPLGTNLEKFENGKYSWLNREMSKKSSGTLEYTWLDNQNKIMVFNHLENGWMFGITMDTKEAFAWITKLQRWIIMIIISSLIIVCIIGYRIGLYITGHLVTLTEHVKVIGDGNYDLNVPENLLLRKDETGILANSIETMRQLQSRSFEQIKKHNKTLEAEIQKRTLSLQNSNQSLESSLNENEKKNSELLNLNIKLEKAISHMKSTQRQLIESEKIASLSFLVSRLAHEFNTPIGNMNMLISFLIEEQNKINDDLNNSKLKKSELVSFVDRLNETNGMLNDNLRRLKMLVNRFKELDPDTHVTVKSHINMLQFIDMVVNSLTLPNPNIGIEILCDPKLELELDAGKFSQVIMHLVENALYHGLSGYLTGLIVIDVRYEDKQLLIRIHDNGIGIPADVMDHIFIPFYTGSLSGKSSGLGLNIVYNIVTKVFGGEILCNSLEEEGTEFIIVINL